MTLLIAEDKRRETHRIKYKKGFKYQLDSDAVFFIEELVGYSIKTRYIRIEDGWVLIKAGYAWNGASGPTIDTKSSMRASLLHDALYQLIRMELLPDSFRIKADHLLHDVMEDDGGWKIRVHVWEKMVNWFAGDSAHPDRKRKVYTAP